MKENAKRELRSRIKNVSILNVSIFPAHPEYIFCIHMLYFLKIQYSKHVYKKGDSRGCLSFIENCTLLEIKMIKTKQKT